MGARRLPRAARRPPQEARRARDRPRRTRRGRPQQPAGLDGRARLVIALDTNVIVYYLVRSQPEHERVRAWVLANTERLATTSINLAEVLRLITHPRLFPRPLKLAAAADLLLTLVESLGIEVLSE